MDRDEALRIVKAIRTAQGPEVVRNDVRRPELTGEAAKGYERVYQTLDCKLISEDDFLTAQAVLTGKSKGGRPPKYDWMLVVQLAIQEVREAYAKDEELPKPITLAVWVSDRYLDLTDQYIDEGQNHDLRKWCSIVLKGFTD